MGEEYRTSALMSLQGQTLDAVQGQLISFNLFRADNPQLDLLLCNLNAITNKYINQSRMLQSGLLPPSQDIGIGNFDEELNGSANSSKRQFTPTLPQNSNTNVANKRFRSIAETAAEEAIKPTLIQHGILKTELVMLKILNFLKNSQLKHFRHVSTNFKKLVDQVIRNRPFVFIQFYYIWKFQTYFLQTSKRNLVAEGFKNNYSLSELTEFIKTCPGFPGNSFGFYNGTLRSPELQEFLTVFGENIKELKLSVLCQPPDSEADDIPIPNYHPSMYSLKKLLTKQVPNLEYLWLSNCPSEWLNDQNFYRLFPEPKQRTICLPNLKKLVVPNEFFYSDSILQDLINSAQNLSELWDELGLENPVIVLKLNKFHLLKQCAFEPIPEELEFFQQKILSTMPSQLCNLNLYLTDQLLNAPETLPTFSNILFNILAASSTTLQCINFHTQIGCLANFTMPILPKIEKITIYIDNCDILERNQLSTKQFPLGFQFTAVFPNLTHVFFTMFLPIGNFAWDNYFYNCNPVLTVKYLSIENQHMPSGWFRNFATLFPNIEVLIVKTINFNLVEASQSGLWNLSQLKQLTLHIQILDDYNAFPSLDSAFTGFSIETCRTLFNTSHDVDPTTTIDEIREYPSIVDLRHIEKLTLVFEDRFYGRRSRYPILLTHVTGLFAFQMCPHLKVNVAGKLRNKENALAFATPFNVMEEYVDLDQFFTLIKD